MNCKICRKYLKDESVYMVPSPEETAAYEIHNPVCFSCVNKILADVIENRSNNKDETIKRLEDHIERLYAKCGRAMLK